MFQRHCMRGAIAFAIAVLSCSTVVDSFVIGSNHNLNHGSHCRTNHKANMIDSSNEAAEQTILSPPQNPKVPQPNQVFPSCIGVLFGLITLIAPLNLPFSPSTFIANAADSKVVGSFSGSGLFFKDTLQVEAFDDPKVQGVKLYVSNFILPINERLSSAKNLFSDPSSASLTCAKTGPIKVADTIAKGTGGEQVFEESKSILFKSLKVQRVYDEEDKTLIYVSYNTRLDKNDDSNKSRFKSSLCAIGLE